MTVKLRTLFVSLILIGLAATSVAAPQLLGIKATNSTVKAFFSEIATGNATWVIKDGNNSIVDAGTSVFSAAVTDSITYPTEVKTAGSYTLTYNTTFLVGNQTSNAAQTVLFSVAAPPPAPTASLVGTLNFMQPPPGVAITGNQIVSGTATSPAGVKEVWFVASPVPPPNDDCSKISGWIRASGTVSWAGVWSFVDLNNIPGTYYITGKLVDTAGTITACNYVQIIYKANTSLAGTPTPTPTPSAPDIETMTCNDKPCTCLQKNQEAKVIFKGRGKITVLLDGSSLLNREDDVLIFRPTKDGTYVIKMDGAEKKSCSISSSSSTGGFGSSVPEELQSFKCTPAALNPYMGKTSNNPTVIDVNEPVRCDFNTEVYYYILPQGTGGRDADYVIDSMRLIPQRNKTVSFTPLKEGRYTISVRLDTSSAYTDVAFYRAEAPAGWIGFIVFITLFGAAPLGVFISYMRMPDAGFNRRPSGGKGAPVYEEIPNVKCVTKTAVGKHSKENFSIYHRTKFLGSGKQEIYCIYSKHVSELPTIQTKRVKRWLKGELWNFDNPAGQVGHLVLSLDIQPFFLGIRKYLPHHFVGSDSSECTMLLRDYNAHAAMVTRGSVEEQLTQEQQQSMQSEREQILEEIRKQGLQGLSIKGVNDGTTKR